MLVTITFKAQKVIIIELHLKETHKCKKDLSILNNIENAQWYHVKGQVRASNSWLAEELKVERIHHKEHVAKESHTWILYKKLYSTYLLNFKHGRYIEAS
jgi:hypothetical protein